MKKILLLLLIIVTFSCSSDDQLRQNDCNCTEEIQYSFIDNGVTTVGDYYENDIQNPDCDSDGQVSTEDTSFNGGIIRKVTTINCQ